MRKIQEDEQGQGEIYHEQNSPLEGKCFFFKYKIE